MKRILFILALAFILRAESDSCKTIQYNSMQTIICDKPLYELIKECAEYNKMTIEAYVYQAIDERIEWDLEEKFFNNK